MRGVYSHWGLERGKAKSSAKYPSRLYYLYFEGELTREKFFRGIFYVAKDYTSKMDYLTGS